MRIKTSKGDTLEGRVYIAGIMRGKPRMVIDVSGATMAQAAEALDGAEWIRVESDDAKGVATTHEGYSRIAMISRSDDGRVRVTLETD